MDIATATTIITTLLGAMGAMGAFFGLIFRDERQRVKDLLARLDEKDKVVTTTVDVLKDTVILIKGMMQVYEVVNKLNDAKDALGSQKQLYDAIAAVQKAAQLFEKNARMDKGARDDR